MLKGWCKRIVTRKAGVSTGVSDTYYFDPIGTRFRSIKSVCKHLEKLPEFNAIEFKAAIKSLPIVTVAPPREGNQVGSAYLKSVLSGKDQFAQTPNEILVYIKERFGFDTIFDPCPASPEINGLTIPWSESTINYVNPPFNQCHEWLHKAVNEHSQGKDIVMLLPQRSSPRFVESYKC